MNSGGLNETYSFQLSDSQITLLKPNFHTKVSPSLMAKSSTKVISSAYTSFDLIPKDAYKILILLGVCLGMQENDFLKKIKIKTVLK